MGEICTGVFGTELRKPATNHSQLSISTIYSQTMRWNGLNSVFQTWFDALSNEWMKVQYVDEMSLTKFWDIASNMFFCIYIIGKWRDVLPRKLKIQSSPGHRTPVPQPADLTNHHTIRSLMIQLRGVVQSVKRVKRHIPSNTKHGTPKNGCLEIDYSWIPRILFCCVQCTCRLQSVVLMRM